MTRTTQAMVCLALIIAICSSAFAFPKLGKSDEDKEESNATVDISLLETSSLVLISNASWATINLMEATVLIFEAIGNKEKAEELSIGVEILKNNPEDEDSLKKYMGETNNAVEELNEMEDLESNLSTAVTFNVASAFLSLGCAIYFDNNALETAKLIVDDSKTALKETPKTKLKEIKRIKAISESAMFLSSNIPVQLKGIASVSTNIVNLAKTRGVELPSQDQIDEKSKGMIKG